MDSPKILIDIAQKDLEDFPYQPEWQIDPEWIPRDPQMNSPVDLLKDPWYTSILCPHLNNSHNNNSKKILSNNDQNLIK